MYEDVLNKVQAQAERLDSLEDWLFVVVNTMKAIVTNSAKGQALTFLIFICFIPLKMATTIMFMKSLTALSGG